MVEQPHLEAGNLGVFAALASAGFTAVAMLGLHRLNDIDPRAVVVHFSTVATVFCGVAFFTTPRSEPVERIAETGVILKLLGIGVSATIGQVFLTLAFGLLLRAHSGSTLRGLLLRGGRHTGDNDLREFLQGELRIG